MSKFHIKCVEDELNKKKPAPKDEDDESPPPTPPSERVHIKRSFEHHESSKFHEKCIENEFTKKKPAPPPPPPPPEPPKRSSLLDIFEKSKDCVCPLVAQAVRSHLHMNIGLQEKRERINRQDED